MTPFRGHQNLSSNRGLFCVEFKLYMVQEIA